MKAYTHGRTCVYNINYHVIVKVIKRYFNIVFACFFQRVACRVGEADHVHCFVSAPPKISVTQIVKYLKGISGHTLLHEYPKLRESLWRGQLWNGSYFCETIGSVSEENVLFYIERQKNVQL